MLTIVAEKCVLMNFRINSVAVVEEEVEEGLDECRYCCYYYHLMCCLLC